MKDENKLKKVSSGMFADNIVAIYQRENKLYFLLNEITDCIGIVRGASSIVTAIGRENIFVIQHDKFKRQRFEYYALTDKVLDYLKRSRKKISKNLYGALLFMLEELKQKSEATNNQVASSISPTSKMNAKHDLIPMAVNGKLLMLPPAEAYYIEQTKKRSEEPETPGYYFDLRQFFIPATLPVSWAKDNYKELVNSIYFSVGVVLKLAENTRGEDRRQVSSLVECLADFLSILNGVEKAEIVNGKQKAI